VSRGSEIRRGLWFRPRYRDILHRQPLDTLGNHPRYFGFGLAVCDLLCTVPVIKRVSWDQRFFDPIMLPGGRKLVTLRGAALYITELPKSEHPPFRLSRLSQLSQMSRFRGYRFEITANCSATVAACRLSLVAGIQGQPSGASSKWAGGGAISAPGPSFEAPGIMFPN